MSRENLSLGFPKRSDTNWVVQQERMAGGLKFHIQEVEGLYYPCRENKGADQLRGSKLICAFVFTYAKSRFSHDAAYIAMLPKDSKDQIANSENPETAHLGGN